MKRNETKTKKTKSNKRANDEPICVFAFESIRNISLYFDQLASRNKLSDKYHAVFHRT